MGVYCKIVTFPSVFLREARAPRRPGPLRLDLVITGHIGTAVTLPPLPILPRTLLVAVVLPPTLRG